MLPISRQAMISPDNVWHNYDHMITFCLYFHLIQIVRADLSVITMETSHRRVTSQLARTCCIRFDLDTRHCVITYVISQSVENL